MAAFIPQVPTSQLVNKIGTKVQRLYIYIYMCVCVCVCVCVYEFTMRLTGVYCDLIYCFEKVVYILFTS